MAVTDSSAAPDAGSMFDRITSRDNPETPPAVTEAAPEPVGETEAQASERAQRERDERGRFKAAEEAAPTDPPQAETTAQAEPKGTIPSGRLREEAERARRAEAALEDFRKEADRRFQDFERRLAANQQPQRPVEPPKVPDMFEDPDGYRAHMERTFEQTYVKRRVDETFDDAREADPANFDKAYAALSQAVQTGDLALRDKIVNAPNPGRALMRWHKEQSALREVGADVEGYRKRITDQALETALKDPEFRKRAMEAWRAEAAQPGAPRPSNVTDIPSLTRTTGSGSSADDGDEPQGPAGVFARISGGKR